VSWLDRLKALDADARLLSGHCQNRQNPGSVSFVGASEAHIQSPKGATDGAGSADDAAREAFEERAAIMEFDGGLSRKEAERRASLPNPPVPAPRRWCFEKWDDLRPCLLCRNLARSGRCLAAWRGEIRAARDYEPSIPAQPRRCIGYAPKADDPDQTSGMERWPELTWQETVLDAGEGTK